jgi:GTP-binding protein
LIDIRLKPQDVDIAFMNRMVEEQVPFYLVFTKSDKISQKQIDENVGFYQSFLLESWESLPEIFITSAEKHKGREEILASISKLIETSPFKSGK